MINAPGGPAAETLLEALLLVHRSFLLLDSQLLGKGIGSRFLVFEVPVFKAGGLGRECWCRRRLRLGCGTHDARFWLFELWYCSNHINRLLKEVKSDTNSHENMVNINRPIRGDIWMMVARLEIHAVVILTRYLPISMIVVVNCFISLILVGFFVQEMIIFIFVGSLLSNLDRFGSIAHSFEQRIKAMRNVLVLAENSFNASNFRTANK